MKEKSFYRKLKFFAAVILPFALIACERNANSQPAPASQTTNVAIETTAIDAPAESAPPAVEEIEHTFTHLTIIPVEPEQLRLVMPNSWRRLERLTEEEEQAAVRENIELFLSIERWRGERDMIYASIFREYAGEDRFYRVIVTPEGNPDFLSPAIQFDQHLQYQGRTVVRSSYGRTLPHQAGEGRMFVSIDILSGGGRAKGVLETTITVWETDDLNPHDWSRISRRRNGQLYGSARASYHLMADVRAGNRSPIEIDASEVLVDPDMPLRFGLQNAFDGNPETAFVANSTTGLLRISIGDTRSRRLSIQRLAIINGDARDMISYRNNNRVKQISLFCFAIMDFIEVELADNTLSWQIIEKSGIGFSVTEVYFGDRYNNTLVAGFNLYSEYYGWLFGDIDEK